RLSTSIASPTPPFETSSSLGGLPALPSLTPPSPPPPRLCDPHARDLHRLAARRDALGRCGCQPGIDQLDQNLDGDAVGEQQSFGASRGRASKQFERAAALPR